MAARYTTCLAMAVAACTYAQPQAQAPPDYKPGPGMAQFGQMPAGMMPQGGAQPNPQIQMPQGMQMPLGFQMPQGMQMPQMPAGMQMPQMPQMPGMQMPQMPGMGQQMGMQMPPGMQMPQMPQMPQMGGNMAGGQGMMGQGMMGMMGMMGMPGMPQPSPDAAAQAGADTLGMMGGMQGMMGQGMMAGMMAGGAMMGGIMAGDQNLQQLHNHMSQQWQQAMGQQMNQMGMGQMPQIPGMPQMPGMMAPFQQPDPQHVFSTQVNQQAEQVAKDHFVTYDSNNDDRMTLEELALLVKAQEGTNSREQQAREQLSKVVPSHNVTETRVLQWMAYYDLNGDGIVEPQEWEYRAREDHLQQLVAQHDFNQDGHITLDELQMRGYDPKGSEDFVKRNDIDDDGQVSPMELVTMGTHAEVEKSFREHDTNKDGFLDWNEMSVTQNNETIEQLLDRYDSDHDRRVSLREMKEADYVNDTKAAFVAHDKNQDGVLDFDEIAESLGLATHENMDEAMKKARNDYIQAHITKYDKDGDKKVSYNEAWGAYNKRLLADHDEL